MPRAVAIRFATMLTLIGVALFLLAATARWWQGWAYLSVMVAANLLLVVWMARNNPGLLKRRMETVEPSVAQRLIHGSAMVSWAGTLVIAALDFRFGWSRPFPVWVAIVGLAGLVVSQWIIFQVFRFNSFAATTVRVESGQTVISTGPYALVRHPMYTGLALMGVATPLALGSWMAMWAGVAMLGTLIPRLLHEESLLRRELPGYAEYCGRVRWRLAPGMF